MFGDRGFALDPVGALVFLNPVIAGRPGLVFVSVERCVEHDAIPVPAQACVFVSGSDACRVCQVTVL